MYSMTLRDAISTVSDPLSDDLYERVTQNLGLIEESIDEARYESQLRIQSLDIYIQMFCDRYGLDYDQFYDYCNLTPEERGLIDEDAASYIILVKLQRGIASFAQQREREVEAELAEIPDDLLDAPIPTTPEESQRLREALKELDERKPAPAPQNGTAPLKAVVPSSPRNAGGNERWVYTRTEDVSHALGKLATELTRLRDTVKQSNEIGSENSPLGPIHRAMLLAMLQAMLIELTQPYVEQGRIKGFFKGLGDLVKKGAKDAVSKGVADALGAAADAGKDFISSLMTAPGIDNLSNLPPNSWLV